jgi:hypothetical protein
VAAARAIYGDPALERYGLGPDPPVHVVVENGRITLEGMVDARLHRQLIAATVRSRTMAFAVENNLVVDGAPPRWR